MKTVSMIAFGFVAALSGGLTGCLAVEPPDDTADLGMPLETEDLGEVGSSLVASLDSTPGPDDVYIEQITTGGPGCPNPSTVSTLIGSDRKTFLVIFDDMLLENPPSPTVKNINCVAGVQLHVPGGWQFSVSTVTTRGYAYLANKIKARQTSKYFFAGLKLAQSFHTALTGFYDGNYSFTDVVGFESLVWSPCGGSAIFAIDTSLNLNAVQNPKGVAIFNTETVDGSFKKEVHWQWQECVP